MRNGKSSRTLLTWLAFSLLASACSDPSDRDSLPPRVGDDFDDGKVVAVVDDGSGCLAVTVNYPEQWACSTEQIALAQEYFSPSDPPADPPAAPPPANNEKFRLAPSSCDDLASLRRPVVKNQQREMLARDRHYILQEKCLPRSETHYVDGTGATCSQSYPSYPYADGGVTGMAGTGGAGGSSSGGTEEYSTTNTQIDGVDEADFVKNNGEHVYVLSSNGLHVIDAWPAPDAHEVAYLPLRGDPRRMFLADDRLLVYSRINDSTGTSPSDQGCTYGYSCRFSSEAGQTLVQIFDVSDPSSPVHLKSFEASGGYVSSRRVGPSVYTVVHDFVTAVPGADLVLDAADPKELEAQYEVKRTAADALIDELPPSFFLPWLRELSANGEVLNELTSCDRALVSAAASGETFVSVVSVDIASPQVPSRTIMAGKAGYVFASAQALYMASDGVDGSDQYGGHSSVADDRSTIHKFALDGLDTRYVGSAAIDGHVLNQFSMDELDGVLRVATSRGWVPDPEVTSNIITLQESGGELKVLGQLSGLAPQEDIRSVRFDGTRAFMVTFKKTDPLFVIDLSTPAQPAVLGELKIPGFSTYMHPLDANHMLAVGFDTDDQGSFAYFDGIQVQIFDVSELSNPLLMHKTVIGTRGSGSEALLNHLAFNYFAPKQMLALPLTICEGGDNGTYADELTFSGLMTFDVSLTNGITEQGKMPFVDPSAPSDPYATCDQWWTDARSNVKRSIFMGDYVIGISDTQLKLSSLDDMSTVLQTLPLDGK